MIKKTPKEIFEEYSQGNEYKNSLGSRGIHEQGKMNERFYVGDQWHGVQAGNTRPLVRRNIIKRIGEYKISALCASPVTVNYSADGIPRATDLKENEKALREQMIKDGAPSSEVTDTEINVIMQALTDYERTTAERLKFNDLLTTMARDAYISGTSFIYTYWDSEVETGLFADKGKTTAIRGDIKCEVVNVSNVILGDPNNDDMQTQPYIIISQRKPISEIKREAEMHKRKKRNVEDVQGDSEAATYNAGDWGEQEPSNNNRATVLTKLWKEYENGSYRVKGIRVTEKTIIRDEWDLGIRLYPISKFVWTQRLSSGYGDSEVTYLIPNQIAINRALSAAIWSAMITGMPKIVVNTDIVDGTVTNDPGQIISINGSTEYDVQRAIAYLHPPQFATQMQNLVADIANSTLSDSGANDAALGNLRPDNASAIIAMREAALQPMQVYQNRYYSCIEDTARIWADFWLNMYGERPLRVEDKTGVQYVPFNADRYRNLVINARVDVGASTLYGEAVVVSSLGNLLQAGIITPLQYLERIPKGTIPDITGLINEIRQNQAAQAQEHEQMIAQFAQQYPEEYASYEQLSEEEKKSMMEQVGGTI